MYNNYSGQEEQTKDCANQDSRISDDLDILVCLCCLLLRIFFSKGMENQFRNDNKSRAILNPHLIRLRE